MPLPKAPPLNNADVAQASAIKRPQSMRYAWPLFGVALFIYGISASGKWWVGSIGVLVLMFSGAAALNRRDDRSLRAAGSGAVRVETVKQAYANRKVQQYVQAGWQLDGQSSAKSLGSQARVTLTFRKP